jgi:hypothetical protein
MLAGAWTDTGWPATMEGAVRSGNAAAREALSFCREVIRARPGQGGAPASEVAPAEVPA